MRSRRHLQICCSLRHFNSSHPAGTWVARNWFDSMIIGYGNLLFAPLLPFAARFFLLLFVYRSAHWIAFTQVVRIVAACLPMIVDATIDRAGGDSFRSLLCSWFYCVRANYRSHHFRFARTSLRRTSGEIFFSVCAFASNVAFFFSSRWKTHSHSPRTAADSAKPYVFQWERWERTTEWWKKTNC